MQPVGRLTTRGSTSTPQQVAIFSSSRVSTPLVGQLKLDGTAQQLPSNVLNNGVILTAKSSNAGDIMIGTSAINSTEDGTGNGYILEPGSSISAGVTNTNVLYVKGTSADVLSWMGS